MAQDAFLVGVEDGFVFFNGAFGTCAVKPHIKEEFLLAFRFLPNEQVAFEERVCEHIGIRRECGTPLLRGSREWDLRAFAASNSDVLVPNFQLEHSHVNMEAMVYYAKYVPANNTNFDKLLKMAGATDPEIEEQVKRNATVTVVKRKPYVGFAEEPVDLLCVSFSNGYIARKFKQLFTNETFNLDRNIRVQLHSEPSSTAWLARAGYKLQDRVRLNLQGLTDMGCKLNRKEPNPNNPNKRRCTTATCEFHTPFGVDFFAKHLSHSNRTDIQNPTKMCYEYLRGKNGNVFAIGTLVYGGGRQGKHLRIIHTPELPSGDLEHVAEAVQQGLRIEFVQVPTEKHLVDAFADDVHKEDPEFLVSMNGFFGSRLNDLFEKQGDSDALETLCRVKPNNIKFTRKKMKRESDQGAGDANCKYVDVKRNQLDLKRLAIADFSLEDTALSTVLATFASTKSQSKCLSWNLMETELWQVSNEEPSEHSVRWLATLLVMMHAAETDGNVVATQMTISGITNTSISDVQIKGQFVRMANMLYFLGGKELFFNLKEFVFGNFPRANEGSGGNVVKPVPGLALGVPHWFMDFSSMYPSIMIQKLLCPSLLVHERDLDRLRALGYVISDVESFTKRIQGEKAKHVALHFVQKLPSGSVPVGLTITALKMTIDKRKEQKNFAAVEQDPEKKNMFDVQQKGWKIVCNSFYGLMMLMYSAFGCVVTSAGRQDQAKAIMLATSIFVCSSGLALRMGDTDSVVVAGKLDADMRKRAWGVLKKLRPDFAEGQDEPELWAQYDAADPDTLQGSRTMQGLLKAPQVQRLHMAFGVWLEDFFKDHFKAPIVLSLENIAFNFLLLNKKKRYCALVQALDTKADSLCSKAKLKQQGVGNRKDIPPLFRDFETGVAEALCKEGNTVKALECFLHAMDEIRSKTTPARRLAFSVQAKNKTDQKENLAQGTVFKLLAKAGFKVQAGDMMHFLYTTRGTSAAESALPLELFDPTSHTIDTDKYIERFLNVATTLLGGIVPSGQLQKYASGQQTLPSSFSKSGQAWTEPMVAKEQPSKSKKKKRKKDEADKGQSVLPAEFSATLSKKAKTDEPSKKRQAEPNQQAAVKKRKVEDAKVATRQMTLSFK